MNAEILHFQELDGDQIKEYVNSQQRYRAWVEARRRLHGYRGSMLFAERRGAEYLLRDYYDPVSGIKRQKSLGRRSPETEALLREFESGKAEAALRQKSTQGALVRQAAINRALGLGRVPDIGARIIRAVDDAGLLGRGIRVVGTNALFAYEAAAGVHLPLEMTTTEDIDMLFDARVRLRFAVEEGVGELTLRGILRRIDRSFTLTKRTFQARNSAGYLVDLIRPMRSPSWASERASVFPESSDLKSIQIAGLTWQESAPAFEAVAIDLRGFPVRLVTPDPRAFAVHKLWLSGQPDREPFKKRRDVAQAKYVAALVSRYLPHLPFEMAALKNFPKDIVEAAEPLFEAAATDGKFDI